MEIRFLADAPGHVDTLAGWHHAQWGALYRDWSRDDAAAELRAHAACRTRPTTLVAHAAAQGVGQLWLFTPEHAAFYARLGWTHVGAAALRGTPVSLMEKKICSEQISAAGGRVLA